MNNPILLTNSGINWLKTVYNKKQKVILINSTNLKQSKKNMLITWEGNKWKQGEKDDLYLKKIITSLDEETISKIRTIAKKWILPILKHIL
ncbi:MAG: hypothetical protein UAT33_02100 [Buchnera aphidicola (Floraphis choui)]